MTFFHNLNANDFTYALADIDKVYVQLRFRKPTANNRTRLVNLGRPMLVNGPKYRSLARDYPHIFNAPAVEKPAPGKREKAWFLTIPMAVVHKQGSATKKAAIAYIKHNKIASLEDFIEKHSQGEPYKRDIVSKMPLPKWSELGLKRRAEVDEFLRVYKRTRGDAAFKSLVTGSEPLNTAVARYLSMYQLQTPQIFRENSITTQYVIGVDGLALDVGKFVYDVFDTILPVIQEFQGPMFRSCSVYVKISYVAFKPKVGSHALELINERQFDMVREYVEAVLDGRESPIGDDFDVRDCRTTNRQIIGDVAEGVLNSMASDVVSELDEMDVSKGSGFIYLYARDVKFWISQYNVLRGGSWIDLPAPIKNKRACLNPQNYNDDYCFQDCLTIAMHHPEHGWSPDYSLGTKPEMLTMRVKEYRNKYTDSRLTFPMPLDRQLWNVAESLYMCNIYVWRLHNDKPVPQAPSECRYKHSVILLYITSEDRAHYVWVKNPSFLVKNMSITTTHRTMHPCPRCCYCLTSEAALQQHLDQCKQRWDALPVMPHNAGPKEACETKEAYELRKLEAGRPKLCASRLDAVLDVPAFILFDLETFARIIPYVCNLGEKAPPMLNQQVVNSGMMIVVDNVKGGIVTFVKRFFGDNTMRELIAEVKEQCRIIFELYMREAKDMIFTDADKARFNAAKECCLCHEGITQAEKRRHHGHYGGKFIGAAHSACNLKAVVTKEIPVLAHSFAGFDGHFVARDMRFSDLSTDDKGNPLISVLADNSQKIKMMKWHFEDKEWKENHVFDKGLANLKLGPGRDVIVGDVTEHGVEMQLVDNIGAEGRRTLMYILETVGAKMAKNDYFAAMTFLRRLDANGRAYINYKLTTERFWADTGLQGIRSFLRNAAAGHLYVDADIYASVLTIMTQFFARRDVKCSVLDSFAQNRNKICADEGFDLKEFKKLINVALYSDKFPRGVKSEALKDLAWEAKFLQEYLMEEYPEMTAELKREKPENVGGRLFARIYFEEERACLMTMMEYVMDNVSDDTISLQHDGLQFHRGARSDEEIEEILRDMESMILYTNGYEVKLVAKPMDSKVVVPADYVPKLQVPPSDFRGNVISSSLLRKAVLEQKKIRREANNNKWTIKWMDSVKHLHSSLANCVASLKPDQFKLTDVYVNDMLMTRPSVNADHLRELMGEEDMRAAILESCGDEEVTPLSLTKKMCQRKGVYPYDHVRDYDVFDEPLPAIDAFKTLQHRQLEAAEGVKGHVAEMQDDLERNYRFARLVWRWLGFTTFRDFHQFYLDIDVYGLGDVIQSYRASFRSAYDLEPLHFPTLPSVTWEALLRKTKVEIELFGPKDMDMYLFTDNLRGGVSSVGTMPFARANNPEMGKELYKPDEPTSYILDTDVTSLYPHCMSKGLYKGNGRWASADVMQDLGGNLLAMDGWGATGYIVEGRFSIPPCAKMIKDPAVRDAHMCNDHENACFIEHHTEKCTCLHDFQADMACLPEPIQTDYLDLSADQKERSRMNGLGGLGDKKLAFTLCTKDHYKVYLPTLQQAVKLGWEVEEIYKCLIFDQEPWMKPYHDFNTDERVKAKDDKDEFKIQFHKNCMNMPYGKTCENGRKYRDQEVVGTDTQKHAKLLRDPKYFGGSGSFEINDESTLTFVDMSRDKVYLNKPRILGFQILDIAKYVLLDYWYNCVKRKYGSRARLNKTDTDSACFTVTARSVEEELDVYRDIAEDPIVAPYFDRSIYPKDFVTKTGVMMFDDSVKGQMGLLKDETKGKVIVEVMALAAKLNSVLVGVDAEADGTRGHKVTARGISDYVQPTLLHTSFKAAHFEGVEKECESVKFRSRDHVVRMEMVKKVALRAFNDKQYLTPDLMTYLPWGIF